MFNESLRPGIKAFLSVMSQETDDTLVRFLRGMQMDAPDGLVDEGQAGDYALVRTMLEDERGLSPVAVDQLLLSASPITRVEWGELFQKRIAEFRRSENW